MAIANLSCLLGIHRPKQKMKRPTIAKLNSQLGNHKCLQTHHEIATGNWNSQLGIQECVKTYYEMTTGNFNSQLGIHKWWKTHHEMATGNLTPFGELKIYKPNGEGRDRGALPCQGASADWLALSMRNHRNGATLPGTPHFRRLSAFPSSLSPSLSPLAPCPLLSCALSPFLTFSPSHFLLSFSFIPCSKSPDLFFCLSFERIIQTSSDERGVMEIITCTLTRL